MKTKSPRSSRRAPALITQFEARPVSPQERGRPRPRVPASLLRADVGVDVAVRPASVCPIAFVARLLLALLCMTAKAAAAAAVANATQPIII